MQAKINLKNTLSNPFTNIFTQNKNGTPFTQNTQNAIFKDANTPQRIIFSFKSNSTQKNKQSSLQSFGFGTKQSPTNVFVKTPTLPTTNIMSKATKKTEDSKIEQENISWSEVRLKGVLKPTNKKLLEAYVKCVTAQSKLLQYNIIQIRCKVYFQKMEFDQENQQKNEGFIQNNNIFAQQYPLPHIQNINGNHRNMREFLNNFISQQIVNNQIRIYLEIIGITPDILKFLVGMNLSQSQIKQFISRRMLLKNIQHQRLNRFGLLTPNPSLFPQNTQLNSDYVVNRGLFNQMIPNYSQHFYDRFVDYILYKDKFSWQTQILEEAQKKYLKSNFIQNQQKQKTVTKLLDELETIGMSRTMELQREERRKRINMLYKGPNSILNNQQNYMRVNKIVGNSSSQNRSTPIQYKKFYMQ